MGQTLSRELFSLEPIDTGRRQPVPDMTTPPFLPGGQGIPGIGNQSPQPPAPIVRPSFLSSFLANLGPALAGGLMSAPGQPFGTGLAGALTGIQEQNRYNTQLQQQQQTQARENALAQSTLASQQSGREYQAASHRREQQLFPYELQEKQLQADLMQGQINFWKSPENITGAVADATKSLGKLSPDEQAQLDAAKKEAQVTRKFDPVNTAVKTISQDRITTARGADATAFKAWKDQFIKEKGRQPNAQEIQNFTTAGAAMRIVGMENLRQDNYLDTTTGTVGTMTAGEFAQANKANPGQYVKFSGQVANAMKGQSLISDIRDGIKQMRAAVNDPNFELSSAGRALMAIASKSPESAMTAVTSGLAAQNLSEQEQNYIIAHATLLERSMSLRGLQGQGAGSDQQRRAIADMLPGLATGDKKMAEKQLKTLENNVDNVAKAIPKIGKGSSGGAGGSTGQGYTRVGPNVVVEQ